MNSGRDALSTVMRWALVALVVGCTGEAPQLHLPSARDMPSNTVTAALLPGPGPQERASHEDPLAINRGCERCHPAIGAEWRQSLHGRAWDDPVFLSAYAVEPTPFCRRCHAPEARDHRGAQDERRHLGVACVTCHVFAGEVRGARATAGSDHHPTVADARITTAAWCTGCHEFAFPKPQEALMQSTVSEHRASAHADTSCQSCHMPRAEAGHRSHRFSVHDNPLLLRSAVQVTPRREGRRGLVLAIGATDVGHAVPTGDLFRRLVVRAHTAEQSAEPVVLGRVFASGPEGSGVAREQIADRRVPADGSLREVELYFPGRVDTSAVHWEVTYQRMGPHEAMLFGVDLGNDETVLASGVVAPAPGVDKEDMETDSR